MKQRSDVYGRWFGARWRWAGPVLAVGVLFLAVGCSKSEAPGDEVLDVFTSIEPLAGLVERIGGGHVRVSVLVPAGREPHGFEPTPKQMIELGRADLFVVAGTLPFERRLAEKVQAGSPDLMIVESAAGAILREVGERHDRGEPEGREAHGDAHDAEAEVEAHEYVEGMDPHVWVGPEGMRVMAGSIARALGEAEPARKGDFEENLAAFQRDLDAADARVREALKPYRGRTVFVFHPAFGYFLDAYGLVQESVELEGKSPTPKQLQALIEKAQEEDVRVIFVQPQFDRRSARTVAEAISGVVVPMDPLARDGLANLEAMAKAVEASLARR